MAVSAIADALVDALQDAGFTEAERRPLPYSKREECADRKCVVIIRNSILSDGTRFAGDRVYELTIVLQKGVADPHSNDEIDPLLADVETLEELWGADGALRHTSLAGATFEEMPEHPTGNLYDPSLLHESKLFMSVTVVRYRLEA